MIEELKTLRDLEFGRNEKEDRKFLKAEAVKWHNREALCVVRNWIRIFFNLTDEELKGGKSERK